MTPVYEIENSHADPASRHAAFDWIYKVEPFVAALALIVLSPVVVVIALTIAALSRRSPLIRHARVGWHGNPLRMLKFRTMWGESCPRKSFSLVEDVADSMIIRKTAKDPRVISRFAAICRQYSLDEIPQLYHVACGQMSLVGPRPLTQLELDTFYGPHTPEVLLLKPGITGLWQILGRSRLSYSRRMKLDVIMVRRASAALYIRVLLRTIPRVVCGHDAY